MSPGASRLSTGAPRLRASATRTEASRHVAVAYGCEFLYLRTMASGQPRPPVSRDDINALNARHGEEYATCTTAEVLDLLRHNRVDAAAFARGRAMSNSGAPAPTSRGCRRGRSRSGSLTS
jgi:hypothetical protein